MEKRQCMWCHSSSPAHSELSPAATVIEIAEQDARDWAYHFLQPGSATPEELTTSGRWREAMNNHIHPDGKGRNRNDFEFSPTNQQEYKRAFLAQYTKEWEHYWAGGD